jgi:hypothetical protein
MFTNFNQLFNHYKEEVFDKSSKIKQPTNTEILEIYSKEAHNINIDFPKLKSDIYPDIDIKFLEYIKQNMTIGPFGGDKHSPIFYTTEGGIDSYRYTSPEIIRQCWVNFKISKLWYEKLLQIGYIVK